MIKNMFYSLESNFWKYFIILLTSRRNYIPILSIYYLTIPNSQAFEIWFYSSAWFLGSLIFGIPISYLADNIGHKKIIILWRFLLFLSTLLFVIWNNFYYFFVWSLFMWLWSLDWIISSFFHDTLTNLKREKEYKKIASTYKAYVSLISVFIIIWLPFLTDINIKLPFVVTLFLDFIGLIASIMIISSKRETKINKEKTRKIFDILKENKWNWVYPIIIFSAVIAWFLSADQAFRWPYLESLWYPVIYIWFVMWLSRFVWFIVWKYIHLLEKYISFKKMLFIEIFIFSWYYILSYFIDNPYIVWLVFSLVIGYVWGRSEIYNDYFFENIEDKKYKSTVLSFKNFLKDAIQIILWISIWFIMNYSYKIWFLTLWIIIFIILITTYWFIEKNLKINS
jgi:MFS family permease